MYDKIINNWPALLKMFEQWLPVDRPLVARESEEGIVYYVRSSKAMLEHIVADYAAYKANRSDKFITWCKVLWFSIPAGVERPKFLVKLEENFRHVCTT